MEQLFKEGGENLFNEAETNYILKALSEVKILDPPVVQSISNGCCTKNYSCFKEVRSCAKLWKEQQVRMVPNAVARQKLKNKLDQSTSDYARKLGVIQNSIYGVDIQPVAAEISKLRCFLSLVIDENVDDDEENRGIEPLPNLEFKFVTANTLIDLDEKAQKESVFDFGETEYLQDKLQILRNDYLQAYGDDKDVLVQEFEEIQKKIYDREIANPNLPNKRALQLASWNPFKNESSEWFNPSWMFGVDKFDIVIGNPPYGFRTVLNKKEKDFFRNE